MPPVISALALLAVTEVSQARDLCDDIDYLTDQSRSHFVKVADRPIGEAGDYGVTLSLPGAAYCFVSERPAGRWYHCGWEFPHRAKEAYETFDALAERLNQCIGSRATLHNDRSVTPPDSDALRRYELDHAEVTVSVKDKSALGSTLVFVRVQGRQGK